MTAGQGRMPWLRRWWPVGVLIAGLAAALALNLQDHLSCDALSRNRAWLLERVEERGWLAGLIYVSIYTAVVAFSIPAATPMTIAGGFLFGSLVGTTYVVIAATLGATAVFLAARHAFAGTLRHKAGPWLARMEEGFSRNAFNYLLVLRLIPLFPFFAINLAAAFLGVRLRTFVAATLVGILPGSFVFVQVGTGLGSVFDAGGECTLAGALTPQVLLALIGLAFLALLPVAYKAARGGR